MSRTFLLPYRAGSASARELATALGVRRINLVRTRYRPRPSDTIINWGNAGEEYTHLRYINPTPSVRMARDKLATFRALVERGVPTVEFTDNAGVAQEWLCNGALVFQRSTTTGQGGAGITVLQPGARTSPAPLYTKAFRARNEYRIHICRMRDEGSSVFEHLMIDAQKKRRRDGVVPGLIRNLENGYVFCRENVTPGASVIKAASDAVAALRLDFGAVDILAKESGEVAVLEVNTAPGLEGTTIERYADAIRSLL